VPPVITRDKLLDGSLAEHFRANAPPGDHLRSQAEPDASLDEVLAGHEQGRQMWVFGYGSLTARTRRAGWPPAPARPPAACADLRGKPPQPALTGRSAAA